MANKLDVTRPIFMGATAAREGTVVDHIRKAVATLDTGTGVLYADLETYLLQNYTPSKSKNYDGSFIKSYVRDAVTKYGYLAQEDGGHAYSVEIAPAAKPRTSTPKAPRVNKTREEMLSVLRFILEAGEVSGPDDVDQTNITIEDVAQELHRRVNWVELKVEAAVSEGLATSPVEEGRRMVYLTAAGYAAVTAAPTTENSEPEVAETAAEEQVSEEV